MTEDRKRIVRLAVRFQNAVDRAYMSHEEAAGYDAGLDAGEFSGPAHWRAFQQDADQIARRLGFTDASIADQISRLLHVDTSYFTCDDISNR